MNELNRIETSRQDISPKSRTEVVGAYEAPELIEAGPAVGLVRTVYNAPYREWNGAYWSSWQ